VGNVEFDDTYLDIIAAAKVAISRGKDSSKRKKYLDMLQRINGGKVTVEKERFYLKPGNQARLEFNLVAEGMRKIALLWQLIKNGTLEKGAILFWDEPEANINPKFIPEIANILLELQREGVQIFVATHDYFLAKYIEARRKDDDVVSYFSLYRKEDTQQIAVEQNDRFEALEHNAILETFMALYHEEIRKAME
jgi:wobble nucleotide-excising tRNase